VEEAGGTLGVRGGGEDSPPVILQDGQPRLKVGRMIVTRLGRKREVGAEEGAAKLSYLS